MPVLFILKIYSRQSACLEPWQREKAICFGTKGKPPAWIQLHSMISSSFFFFSHSKFSSSVVFLIWVPPRKREAGQTMADGVNISHPSSSALQCGTDEMCCEPHHSAEKQQVNKQQVAGNVVTINVSSMIQPVPLARWAPPMTIQRCFKHSSKRKNGQRFSQDSIFTFFHLTVNR